MVTWVVSNVLIGSFLPRWQGRVTFLLEWGKTLGKSPKKLNRQGTCQRGCCRYHVTQQGEKRCVTNQVTTSADRDKLKREPDQLAQFSMSEPSYTTGFFVSFLDHSERQKNSRVFARFSTTEENKKNRS